jgi:sulfonate transport system permease protein
VNVRAWVGTAVRGLIVPLALLAAWEVLSRRSSAAAYAFVPLRDIGAAWKEALSSGELLHSLASTLRHAGLGLVAGSTVGLVVGSGLGLSRTFDRIVGPLYHGLRQVPLLGLVPLIGLWFGNGDGARLLVVSLAAFYPVTLATAEGLRGADRAYLELARALVLHRVQTFRHVLLPGAVPAIVSGLLQAVAFTWIAAVGSELLFAAGTGLGTFMQQGQASGRMELVIVGIGAIAITGSLMNGAVARTGRWVLRGREA